MTSTSPAMVTTAAAAAAALALTLTTSLTAQAGRSTLSRLTDDADAIVRVVARQRPTAIRTMRDGVPRRERLTSSDRGKPT